MHAHKPLPVGTHYFPHIVRADDPKQEHWSAKFVITESNQAGEGMINLTMLVENEQTEAFFETLMPNTEFILLEGMTEVARGYMK